MLHEVLLCSVFLILSLYKMLDVLPDFSCLLCYWVYSVCRLSCPQWSAPPVLSMTTSLSPVFCVQSAPTNRQVDSTSVSHAPLAQLPRQLGPLMAAHCVKVGDIVVVSPGSLFVLMLSCMERAGVCFKGLRCMFHHCHYSWCLLILYKH